MLYPEQLVDTHVIAIISTNSEPHLEDWRNALGSLTWITARSDGYAQPITEPLGSINVESPQNRQLKPHLARIMCGSAGERDFCKVVCSHATKK